MKIAILSDTHDHIWNLDKVLEQIKGNVKAIIHCGDFCAAFMPIRIASLNLPVYACFGNVDEDQAGMVEMGGENFHWTPLLKEFGTLELGGRKIAYCHYPRLGELLAKSGEYDAVFHGHNHTARNEKFGKTLLLNPGAVCGIQRFPDGFKQGVASYAIYNTKTNSAVIIDIV